MPRKADFKKIARLTGGQVVAGGVEQFVLPQVDSVTGMAGVPAWQRPSTWAGILGGLGIAYFGMRSKSGGDLLGIIGTHMIANSIVTAGVELVPTQAAPRRVIPAARPVQAVPTPSVTVSPPRHLGEFPNGSSVVVD